MRKSRKQSGNDFGGDSERERMKRKTSVWNIMEEAIERKRNTEEGMFGE